MRPEENSRKLPNSLWPDRRSPRNSGADELLAPAIAGCDVTEFDESTGQKAWDDSVFVQDFTDSVLGTAPAPFDTEADQQR